MLWTPQTLLHMVLRQSSEQSHPSIWTKEEGGCHPWLRLSQSKSLLSWNHLSPSFTIHAASGPFSPFCRYPNLAWTPNGPYSLFCLPTFHLFLIESELFPCSKAQNPPVVPSSLQGRASMLTPACRDQHSDLILSLNLPRVTFLSFCSSPTGLFIVVPQIAPSSGRLRASQVALMVKNMPANAGDVGDEGLIPGSGRSPGGWHGNPLQYSCLENLMDSGAWRATVHRLQRVGYDWSDLACSHWTFAVAVSFTCNTPPPGIFKAHSLFSFKCLFRHQSLRSTLTTNLKLYSPYPAEFFYLIIVFILFMVSPFLEYMLSKRRVCLFWFWFVFVHSYNFRALSITWK